MYGHKRVARHRPGGHMVRQPRDRRLGWRDDTRKQRPARRDPAEHRRSGIRNRPSRVCAPSAEKQQLQCGLSLFFRASLRKAASGAAWTKQRSAAKQHKHARSRGKRENHPLGARTRAQSPSRKDGNRTMGRQGAGSQRWVPAPMRVPQRPIQVGQGAAAPKLACTGGGGMAGTATGPPPQQGEAWLTVAR
jgi:hypothetical protein